MRLKLASSIIDDIMVDIDAKDAGHLVLAAKDGNWDEVFTILGSKPNLINCIPEGRAWAALHHAVCWQDEAAIRKLLESPACDPEVKTKRDKANEVGPGKTALTIAKTFRKNARIAGILDDHFKKERRERLTGKIPSYVTAERGQQMDKDGLPLLLLTLASYKKTFHPSKIPTGEAFSAIMKEIFENEDVGRHWRDAKERISSSIGAFDKDIAENLLKCTTEADFFASIVNTYTRNSNGLYRKINEALRREGLEQYKAKGEDLILGPYALLLDVLLFYWPELAPGVATTTYRGMRLNETDLEKYGTGARLVWLGFVSSSTTKDASYTGNVKFEIDNSTPDAELWRPRSIKKFSNFPDEEEALYPAGAEFEVTGHTSDGSTTSIMLRLINPLH